MNRLYVSQQFNSSQSKKPKNLGLHRLRKTLRPKSCKMSKCAEEDVLILL